VDYHSYVVLLIDDELAAFGSLFPGAKCKVSLVLLKLTHICLNQQLTECTGKNYSLSCHHFSVYDVAHKRNNFCCKLNERVPHETQFVIHSVAYTLEKLWI
jgi:hypothetical protein